MDTVEALLLLDGFRDTWKRVAKNKVLDSFSRDKGSAISIFFELTHYQVGLHVMIGPKLGITEWCTIVDTRDKSTDVDHLVTASEQAYRLCGNTLFDMSEEVLKAKRSRDRVALKGAISKWLMEELARFRNSLKEFEDRVQDIAFNNENTIRSGVSIRPVRNRPSRT